MEGTQSLAEWTENLSCLIEETWLLCWRRPLSDKGDIVSQWTEALACLMGGDIVLT